MLTAALLASVLATTAPLGFAERVLAVHNRERAAICAPPLAWDPVAAEQAAVWARHLTEIGDLRHHGDSGEKESGQGENLFSGTRDGYTVEAMLGLWIDEKILLARLGSWEDDFHAVGHYTQMVWSTTTHVGCAVASNAEDDYLVCRYSPPGNVVGGRPYPVRAASAPVGCAPRLAIVH